MAKFLRYLAWTAAILGVLIGILRYTVIRWWQVPPADPYLDSSITPTLHGGDWVILWRGSAPKDGDLTICAEPDSNRLVIGRMVGLPGERIKLAREQLIVNDKPAESDSTCDPFTSHDPQSGLEEKQPCSDEKIADKTHLIGMIGENSAKVATADVAVSADHAFLVSDNRLYPYDSRDFGQVVRSTCVETIVFRLISKDGFFDVANRFSLIH